MLYKHAFIRLMEGSRFEVECITQIQENSIIRA